jgi:hypothetical protein
MKMPTVPNVTFKTRLRHLYPLRIMARVFAILGLAAVVYSVVLIEMNFQSQIIAF